ncbi:hypothetical protein LDENG_00254760 [Lucifuga dentata]|nr:hypothetical protein LDENG_00254760 [Lucifuga dentata]
MLACEHESKAFGSFGSPPPVFSSRGAPAMNPSSLGFSRQSNLSARRCVGIPKVWVLPTQDSQSAPEQKE